MLFCVFVECLFTRFIVYFLFVGGFVCTSVVGYCLDLCLWIALCLLFFSFGGLCFVLCLWVGFGILFGFCLAVCCLFFVVGFGWLTVCFLFYVFSLVGCV